MLSSKNSHLLRNGFELIKGDKLFQDVERDILRLIFWADDMTQARIVEATKIPQQTVSRLINALIEKGALKQTSKVVQSTRGKPSFELKPNESFAYCYGLSILLDAISVSLMDFRGNVLKTCFTKMEDMSIDHVLKTAFELKTKMSEDCHIPYDKELGMGVGISGFFSSMDGKMNTHHKLEEWSQIDIAQIVSNHFALPVWVVNDATCAAAGEGISGIGRNYKNFVYLFVSAAFGGGLISNGEMLRGTFGNAGELGDMIPPKMFVHPNLELLRKILFKHGIEVESVYDFANEFDINWPGVDEWIFKVQDALDMVATSCSALLDTQAIILGGHIPKVLAEKLIPRIEIYAQFRRGAKRPLPEIVVAGIDKYPVSVGAASLPIRELCI